jgi:hypothetical protein
MTTGAAEEAVMDSGEKRLNELGYKQELRREMVRFPTPPSRSLFFFVFHFSTKLSRNLVSEDRGLCRRQILTIISG